MGGDVRKIPQDCCRMFSVICTYDGQVIGIDWHKKGLTGFIAPEIGNLVNLQRL